MVLRTDGVALAVPGDARAAWGGVQLHRGRRLHELPRQRVLAPAGPDQENTHRASLVPPRGGSRAAGRRMTRMDEARFQRWLDDYVEAWRTYEPAAIGELFSEEAEYRYHPWDAGEQVLVGREAIVAAWLDDRDEPGSWTARYRPWLVAGDAAVAVGVSHYLAADGKTVDREYHNVFLCRFDAEDRCLEFTELFMRRGA